MLQATSGQAAVAKEATSTFPPAWDSHHRANPGDYRCSCGVRYVLTAKHLEKLWCPPP